MSVSEGFVWTLVAVGAAAVLTVLIVVWDGWMERRGWRGWNRPGRGTP